MERPPGSLLAFQLYTFYFLFILKFPFLMESKSWIFHFIWECISYFNVFLPLLICLCNIMAAYQKFVLGSLPLTIHFGNQAFWLLISFIIMMNFKLTSRRLIGIVNEIDETFKWRSPTGRTYITSERSYKLAKYVSVLWQIVRPSSVVYSILNPLIRGQLALPSADWFFFNLMKPSNFILAYILQTWTQLIVICSFVAGNTFVYTSCILLCGQFNILKCSLKNLIFTSGVYRRLPHTLLGTSVMADSIEYLYDKELDDNLHLLSPMKSTSKQLSDNRIDMDLTPAEIASFRQALISCVNHHIQLLKICRLLESYMNFFVLLHLGKITFRICVLVFFYQKFPNLLMLVMFIYPLFDLYLLTYPPNHVIEQNESIATSLIMGSWNLMSKHFGKDFGFIVMVSHTRIQFSAGKLLDLNVRKFRQVLLIALSYYLLLIMKDGNKSLGN